MSTTDYLIDHAVKNVWCSPEQDYQYIVRPRRLSPSNGVRNKTEVLWSTIPLPTSDKWYHLYQIGEITPSFLGLGDRKNQWIQINQHCATEYLLVDLYTKAGLMLPRFKSFILVTTDGNVLVAVEDIPKIAKLGSTDLYMRFYSNAYFNTAEAQLSTEGIKVKGTVIVDANHLATFSLDWRNHKIKSGYAYAFVNGYRVYDINVLTTKVGDVVEFVWDSSIKQVIEFPLASTPSFQSLLDEKQKFLIHYQGLSSTIEYRDDIDMFLIKRVNQNIYSGVYYHKNREDAVRMVTHKDYSIPVQYVEGYVNDIATWNSYTELTVQLHIRKSGYNRPLVNVHNRIKELYKLSDSDIVMAMMGTESNLPEWRADNLELSQYTEIMRYRGSAIPKEMVQNAYGYNAISKLVADTPQVVPMPNKWVTLPIGLWNNSTIYEYDSEGILLEFHNHTSGRMYATRHPNCTTIEGIVGIGSNQLTTLYNKTNVVLKEGSNYRFYVSTVVNDVAQGDWIDVTGDSTYYDVVSGAILWKVDTQNYKTAIKNDDVFLAYDLEFAYRDGILRFTVNDHHIYFDEDVVDYDRAEIPFGSLDIWLNGKTMIQGLDYYIENWPEVCIVNKEFLVPGDTQRITIRGTGFCKEDMSIQQPIDYGFVRYGLLSKNNRFDIRDDKVMRVIVDGKLYDMDDLRFSEENSGVQVPGIRNGAPYQLNDIIVPLRDLVSESTYSLREKSTDLDKRISDYLTLKLPEPQEPYPTPIPRLYQIYSPYASKVMYDLINGIIQIDDFMGQYGAMDLKEALIPYEWLLKYDPALRDDVDLDYVSIHPHNLQTELTLNVYQYRFLLRTIQLKLKDRVDITKFIRIETGFEHETPDHPHPYQVAP